MIELNTFYNEDCLLTIEKMDIKNQYIREV